MIMDDDVISLGGHPTNCMKIPEMSSVVLEELGERGKTTG